MSQRGGAPTNLKLWLAIRFTHGITGWNGTGSSAGAGAECGSARGSSGGAAPLARQRLQARLIITNGEARRVTVQHGAVQCGRACAMVEESSSSPTRQAAATVAVDRRETLAPQLQRTPTRTGNDLKAPRCLWSVRLGSAQDDGSAAVGGGGGRWQRRSSELPVERHDDARWLRPQGSSCVVRRAVASGCRHSVALGPTPHEAPTIPMAQGPRSVSHMHAHIYSLCGQGWLGCSRSVQSCRSWRWQQRGGEAARLGQWHSTVAAVPSPLDGRRPISTLSQSSRFRRRSRRGADRLIPPGWPS